MLHVRSKPKLRWQGHRWRQSPVAKLTNTAGWPEVSKMPILRGQQNLSPALASKGFRTTLHFWHQFWSKSWHPTENQVRWERGCRWKTALLFSEFGASQQKDPRAQQGVLKTSISAFFRATLSLCSTNLNFRFYFPTDFHKNASHSPLLMVPWWCTMLKNGV